MKKRLYSLILVIMISLNLMNIQSVSASAIKTAEAVLGASAKLTNFSSVEMGVIKTPIIESRNDRTCWVMDKKTGDNSKEINFVLDKKFVGTARDGSVYEVEVDYYDDATGYFTYYYDGMINDNQHGDEIYLTNTKEWKTARFRITDACFEGGLDGKFDFRLSIKTTFSGSSAISSASVAVSGVRMKKYEKENCIYATASTDEVGNVFEWYSDKKIIHNSFENLTQEALSAKVRYYAFSEETEVMLFEKEDSITLEPGETKTMDIDISEYERCDLYNYYIEIISDEHRINSKQYRLQFAIMKTDPDGIKNRNVFIGTHCWQHENFDQAAAVIDKANIGGVRIDNPWWYIEAKEKGQYVLWDTKIGQLMTELLNRDVQVLPLFTAGSFLYTRNHNVFPSTDEQMEAYRNVCAWLAKEYTSHGIKQVEIWNEPDVQNGTTMDNGEPNGGAAYVPVYNIALEEFKKVDPEFKVMGAATCWASTSDIFLQAAIDAGWADTIDVFSGHPYTRQPDEIAGTAESYLKWKNNIYNAGGPEDIEAWATEVGFTLADGEVANIKKQGNQLARKCIHMRAMNAADVVGLFTFERRGMIKYDREDMYGNVQTYDADIHSGGILKPYTPTVSMLEIAAECYMLAESEPTEIFSEGDANIKLYNHWSNKFNKNVLAIYSVEGEDAVTLDLGTDKVDYYDEYGNMCTVYGRNGIFHFTTDERPTYLVGDIKQADIVEDNFITYNKTKIDSSKNDRAHVIVTKPEGENYTIRVTNTSSGLKVTQNNGFNGNYADIYLDVVADIGKETFAVIDVMDGEKIVQRSRVFIRSSDAAVATINASLPDLKQLNRWNASMLINNTSGTLPIKGYVQFNSPANFAKLGKIDIGVIPRSRTGKVEFAMPEIKEKGQYTLDYDIFLDNGNVISNKQVIDFSIAPYAETKPTIDGIVEPDEWEENAMMYVNTDAQWKTLIQREPWRGVEDLSGGLVIEWDEDNFYLMAKVTDDVFYHQSIPSQMYVSDNIQFGLVGGVEGYIVAGQGGNLFHELSIGKSTEGDKVYRHNNMGYAQFAIGIVEDCEIAVSREGTTTYYECSIPWKSLVAEHHIPHTGEFMGFSYLINENDGTGRRGWLEYASGIGESKNRALFTTIQFIR